MIKRLKQLWKKMTFKVLPFLIATIGQGLIRLLLWTCRWQVEGLERFKQVAAQQKCIVMLWHNRLALAPSILYRFAPQFIYAALVSKSRDGELISAVIHSYSTGRTIRVSHQGRHHALIGLIRHLETHREVVIITPDGPRGPCYQMKPGIALAALETSAHVVALDWTASKQWELNTWDRLRLPKPFSTIRVSFKDPIVFDGNQTISVEQAQDRLQEVLPT